jgi:hypothetical protein
LEKLTPLDAAAKAKAAYRKQIHGLSGESVASFTQKCLTVADCAAAAKRADSPEEAARLWALAVTALPEIKNVGPGCVAVVLEVTLELLFNQFNQCTTAARCFLEDAAQMAERRAPALLTAADVYGLASQTRYGVPAAGAKRPAVASASASGSGYRPGGYSTGPAGKRQKQPCRDFKSATGCRFGANCKFTH